MLFILLAHFFDFLSFELVAMLHFLLIIKNLFTQFLPLNHALSMINDIVWIDLTQANYFNTMMLFLTYSRSGIEILLIIVHLI